MPPAGAAHPDHQLAFALPQVQRNGKPKQIPELLQHLVAFRGVHHIVAHGLFGAVMLLQLRHVVGVGQAAHIKNQIGILRQPVAEPEGNTADEHGRGLPLKQAHDAPPQLVGGKRRRIDAVVGALPDRPQQAGLLPDGVLKAALAVIQQGMTAAVFLIAAQQHVVGGL